MPEFKRLFEPGKIGKLELKNRILFAPMVTRYISNDGGVTDRLLAYYVERAQGGAGAIVTEAAYPRSSGYVGRILLNDDKCLPGLKKLVDAIHKEQAKIICEVNVHRGRVDEFDPASASPVPHPLTKIIPRQLSIEDIHKLIEDFGNGIRRVNEAGFDGMMIHGATGYLITEFLSPLVNRRTDQYGVDLKGRARFLLELVAAAKKSAGPDFPIIARITADDKLPGGFGIAEGVKLCQMLEAQGVDAIDVTAGSQETTQWTFPPTYMPPGTNAGIAEIIKKQIRIPVSVAGKVNDPYVAEEILKANQADFVDMGRALLADPFLPRKAMEGRADEIRRCIACQRCMDLIAVRMIPLACTVNPAAGREREFESGLKPATKKKKVLVIGGGPGGMQAAVFAAQRGHNVTLWEASDTLGGQLNLAVIPPGKTDLNSLKERLEKQLKLLKVDVKLRKKATASAVQKFAPDAVVIAVGSKPFIPDIPGRSKEIVTDCRQVLSGEKPTGNSVVVIGGGLIGCETADFLADKGKKVTLAFRSKSPMAKEIVVASIWNVVMERLEAGKVKIMAEIKRYQEITDEGIKLIDKDGKEVLLKADTIVFASGSRPNKTLAKSLKGKAPELYEIGDSVEARHLMEAVHEGADAALKI
ncbi:MAG: FAD-dependent oxidoreductase [Chloroflexota bacterium]